MPEDHFGAGVARTGSTSGVVAHKADPAVVGPGAVDSWPPSAAGGSALKLGSGTGRIALPLADRRRTSPQASSCRQR